MSCALIILAIGNVFHAPDGPEDLVILVDRPLFSVEFDLIPASRVGVLVKVGGISGRYTVPDPDQFPAVDHSRPDIRGQHKGDEMSEDPPEILTMNDVVSGADDEFIA